MKTKTMKKKPGVTAGEVFGRMVEDARFFDYMVYGPGENPWDMEFRGFHQIDDYVIRVKGDVVVDDIMHCDLDTPVTIKGDTVEVVDEDYTYLFRFYRDPPRIENLKDMVK